MPLPGRKARRGMLHVRRVLGHGSARAGSGFGVYQWTILRVDIGVGRLVTVGCSCHSGCHYKIEAPIAVKQGLASMKKGPDAVPYTLQS